MADLEFTLHGPDFAYIDRFTASSSTNAFGWTEPGVAQITIPDDHRIIGKLVDGCRVGVRFRDVEVMEGYVWGTDGQTVPVMGTSGVKMVGTVVLSVLDDRDLINGIEGWPDPAAALSAQTDDHARYIGKTETVLKAVLAANIARLGLPWTVAPDLARGSDQTVDFRFDPIGDKMFPLLKSDKLGLVVTRTGSSFEFDVAEAVPFARPLTLGSGVVGPYKWSTRRPGATRMVGGGTSSGTSRAFAQQVDATLEAAWGVREKFSDQSTADTPTLLSNQTTKALNDAGPTGGFSAELAEKSWFQFDPTGAHGFALGAEVTVQPPGADFSAVIDTVTVTDTPDDGVKVVPSAGDFFSPRRRMYRSVKRLMVDVARMERR
jgi:hypothetical protein